MSGKSPGLSAVVIAGNEEKNIGRCLESLRFCDEIVVVDSFSKDRTPEIARSFTPRVYSHPWSGYSEQKNHANSLVTNDWVLSVDADEVVTSALREEILTLLAKGPGADAYSVPRKTIHFGRWIRYGGWYPDRMVRLFRRSRGRWEGDEVHERWISEGKVEALNGDLEHFSFEDLTDQVERNNRYSSLGALHLQRRGKPFTLPLLLIKPFSKFIETYFLKKGFLDGYPGFIISVSAAYSVFLKWAKLWELEHREEKN